MERVVVVGASLAGVRAGEALRRYGFDGHLTIVGEEASAPYDRPPLSKQVLAGAWEPERLALKVEAGVQDCLRLATRAVGLDLGAREVVLDTDERLAFDGLVIASGAVARTLPGADLDGVFTLRTDRDCEAIRGAAGHARNVVVIGAGFIGSEVASTCRTLGLEVTVVEALPVPLERAVGPEMGAVLGGLHAEHGVTLLVDAAVTGFEGDQRVEGVRLADGAVLPADLVVVGIGVRPATDWLEGSGLELADGVVCDEFCAARSTEGEPAEAGLVDGVVACGDVARWHNPLYGRSMRVEHWTNAVEQADAAARTLVLGPVEPYAPVPYFWSDQYGARIRFVGHAEAGDAVAVVEGSTEDRRFVAAYERDGRCVAALTVNMPHRVMAYRTLIAERQPVVTPE